MSTSPMKPILEVRDISFRYNERGREEANQNSLGEINFDLFPGETLGVVGRNGAGKSTLLQLIAGVMKPSAGSIIAAQHATCSLLALGVGFMEDLSGADNVVITLMLQGMVEAEARERLPEIHAFSELGEAFYRRVKTYSSGMRSRLTFSASLHGESDILLIDEVLAVGDWQFREKARKALRRKIKGNQTVMLVSHSSDAIRQLCDRVLLLEQGKQVCVGGVQEVMELYERGSG